jgi:transcriptional regulator with XRE-family HTH domain
MKTLGERIKFARESRNRSQTWLGEQVGIKQQSIHSIETGDAGKTAFLVQIARALNYNPNWLLTGEGEPENIPSDDGMCPIVGYIGAGAQIFPYDDHAQGEGFGMVPKPPHFVGDCVAVAIRGNSMRPLKEGWLVFYRRDSDGVPDECLNELCVVKIADGPTLVKDLRRGRKPGRYRLDSWNADPMEDVVLEWAALVIDIRPRKG